ncbi:MAG TPA: Ig-like domain-containing protein [Microlunatus sp.]
MTTSGRLARTGVAGSMLLITALAACSTPPSEAGGRASDAPTSTSTSASSKPGTTSTPTPTAAPVALSTNVKDGAKSVKVDTLVSAKASSGTLSKVTLAYSYTDGKGKKRTGNLDGALNKDKTSWTAGDRLEPAGSYKLTMVGKNAAGDSSTKATSFKAQNLTLQEQTFASLYPLKDTKVGIGMPVVVNFDVPVSNKKEFEKNLHVTSSPKQEGTWRWFSSTEVRFRPKTYWKPGTKVTVKADLNGVSAGKGIYGQSSANTSFTVGRSMITKVNLSSDVATVYVSGKKVRTIYVSGGKPGWQTRSGTKLIMGKEYNKKMTNEMIGAEEDYSLTAKYALRITNSGEFLHSAPWNTGNFGVRNASHGCVGMSTGDSGWLYERALVGDPVVTTGSSKGMELGNGYGDWNVSYNQYKKGSAL